MTDERPVLVTGGTGFIGSYVTRALLDAGRRVIAYDVRRADARGALRARRPRRRRRGGGGLGRRLGAAAPRRPGSPPGRHRPFGDDHEPGLPVHQPDARRARQFPRHGARAGGGAALRCPPHRLYFLDRRAAGAAVRAHRCRAPDLPAARGGADRRVRRLQDRGRGLLLCLQPGVRDRLPHGQAVGGLRVRDAVADLRQADGRRRRPRRARDLLLGRPVPARLHARLRHRRPRAGLPGSAERRRPDLLRRHGRAARDGGGGGADRELVPGSRIEIPDTLSDADQMELPYRGRLTIENASAQLSWEPRFKNIRDGLADYVTRYREFLAASS